MHSELLAVAPLGIRDDGSVLPEVAAESLHATPVWPLSQKAMEERRDHAEPVLGVDENEVDPNALEEVGWAVLLAPGLPPQFREAIGPLLAHRKKEIDDPRLFQIFDGDYRPPESAQDWLTRHQWKNATVDPKRGVPYYFLIVAPPDQIPFEFQYQLDIFWAVGRIWFDTAAEFRQYADSVIAYETSPQVSRSRQVAVFAPTHAGDAATSLLMDQVAVPFTSGERPLGAGRKMKFQVQPFLGSAAGKADLHRIFRGDIAQGPPALLFSGSHGRATEMGTPDYTAHRGALVCSDWRVGQEPGEANTFGADDLGSDAKVHGLIHFLFACYGGGWPEFDDFQQTRAQRRRIADRAAIAPLVPKLLSHPGGGALAVIAHIDRAFACSFQSDSGAAHDGDLRMVMNGLMAGNRVGHAMDRFNQTWAARSTEIAEQLRQIQFEDRKLSPEKLRWLTYHWIARDDARNYVVLGDPAVRPRTKDMPVLPPLS